MVNRGVSRLPRTMATESSVEDIVFDDGERIEIACSHPDAETAIKALRRFAGEGNE